MFKREQRFGFILFLFGHCVVLSLLRFTGSDYPFGIFKLLLTEVHNAVLLYDIKVHASFI
jgi:hypothetical protein